MKTRNAIALIALTAGGFAAPGEASEFSFMLTPQMGVTQLDTDGTSDPSWDRVIITDSSEDDTGTSFGLDLGFRWGAMGFDLGARRVTGYSYSVDYYYPDYYCRCWRPAVQSGSVGSTALHAAFAYDHMFGEVWGIAPTVGLEFGQLDYGDGGEADQFGARFGVAALARISDQLAITFGPYVSTGEAENENGHEFDYTTVGFEVGLRIYVINGR